MAPGIPLISRRRRTSPRIRGGVFGFGLSRDVRAAYRFLVQNFEPGDQLFFFGFSRGASLRAAPPASSETRAFCDPLWKQQASAQGQRLEQVWFAGVHCDVGGGYLGHQLSDIPLLWMVDRARECGLVFDPEAFTPALPGDSDLPETEQTVRSRTSVSPDPLFLPHESRKGAYRLVWPFNRSLGVEDPEHEHVASTAVELYDETMKYSPSGLVTYLDGDPHITEVRSTL